MLLNPDYGQIVDKHMRLVKARNMLARLVKSGRMFTFLDSSLYNNQDLVGSMPATNNPIEGGVNTQLRAVLRTHRGMSISRQLRTIGWWCYMHTTDPATPAEILRIMPTDEHITHAYQQAACRYYGSDTSQWGTGIEWTDLHHSTPWNQPH